MSSRPPGHDSGEETNELGEASRVPVLIPRGGRPRKVHVLRQGKVVTLPLALGVLHKSGESPAFRGVADLGACLGRLAEWGQGFVVRARRKDAFRGEVCVNRRVRGADAHWEECDRRWVMLDIDQFDFPDINPSDTAALEQAVDAVVKHLPREFHGVSTFAQFSASAFVPLSGQPKLHLWYWLSRAVAGPSLASWLRTHAAPVDAAVLRAVQPHFIASPEFRGLPDPVARRRGVLLGACDEVRLPDDVVGYDALRAQADAAAERRAVALRAQFSDRYRSPGQVQTARARYARAALRLACERIVSAAESTRHDTIVRESAGMKKFIDEGTLDRQTAIDELTRAALQVLPESRASEAVRTVADMLDRGTDWKSRC